MSQSDYIQQKRVAIQVASKNRTPIDKGDNPAVLSSQLLTRLNAYDLENTVVNSVPRFNQLVPSTDIIIMGMNLRQPSASCKTYRTCNMDEYNTNTLPNTVLVKTFYDFGTNKPYVDPSTMSPYK
jgi:hypothetical protein